MAVPSVLAVFAHPDDESLSAGGLLARQAGVGGRTAVVTATWAPGTRRADELAEALRILGADAPRMLGYADARVPDVRARVPAPVRRAARRDRAPTGGAHPRLPSGGRGHPRRVRRADRPSGPRAHPPTHRARRPGGRARAALPGCGRPLAARRAVPRHASPLGPAEAGRHHRRGQGGVQRSGRPGRGNPRRDPLVGDEGRRRPGTSQRGAAGSAPGTGRRPGAGRPGGAARHRVVPPWRPALAGDVRTSN